MLSTFRVFVLVLLLVNSLTGQSKGDLQKQLAAAQLAITQERAKREAAERAAAAAESKAAAALRDRATASQALQSLQYVVTSQQQQLVLKDKDKAAALAEAAHARTDAAEAEKQRAAAAKERETIVTDIKKLRNETVNTARTVASNQKAAIADAEIKADAKADAKAEETKEGVKQVVQTVVEDQTQRIVDQVHQELSVKQTLLSNFPALLGFFISLCGGITGIILAVSKWTQARTDKRWDLIVAALREITEYSHTRFHSLHNFVLAVTKPEGGLQIPADDVLLALPIPPKSETMAQLDKLDLPKVSVVRRIKTRVIQWLS